MIRADFRNRYVLNRMNEQRERRANIQSEERELRICMGETLSPLTDN